jgi:hypothetical protein
MAVIQKKLQGFETEIYSLGKKVSLSLVAQPPTGLID